MKITVIIPTLNRLKELKNTLKSISKQKIIPEQIIIVDQSENNLIKNYIKTIKLPIKYLYQKEKSTAKARNLGFKYITGDIVCFLDDDILLDKNYFNILIKIFKNKNVLGATGDIYPKTSKSKTIYNIFNKIYNLFFFNDKIKKFAVSGVFGTNHFIIKPKKEYYNCEWLSGCNLCVRKSILKEFQFDNSFIKYSYKEDVDFSNRIYRKYPNTLVFSPKLKLTHLATPSSRLPSTDKMKMKWINFTYIYLKHNKINFIYYWSSLGQLLKILLRQGLTQLWKELKVFNFTLKNKNKILSGDLNFYNWD